MFEFEYALIARRPTRRRWIGRVFVRPQLAVLAAPAGLDVEKSEFRVAAIGKYGSSIGFRQRSMSGEYLWHFFLKAPTTVGERTTPLNGQSTSNDSAAAHADPYASWSVELKQNKHRLATTRTLGLLWYRGDLDGMSSPIAKLGKVFLCSPAASMGHSHCDLCAAYYP